MQFRKGPRPVPSRENSKGSLLLKLSKKQQSRRDAFNRFGKGNTCVGDPDVPDYMTGKESKFVQASSNDAEMNRWDKVVAGPQFRTPGWVRTVKE